MTVATATASFDLTAAPMRIASVRLRVRDLDTVAAFYRDTLGLDTLDHGDRSATLGQGGAAMVELAGDPALAPRDPRQAGLFHTAFLLPDRADLGRWLDHARGQGVTLDGASDHIVSEAVYLSDPEGNGVEIYADRAADRWTDDAGRVQMATRPLDLPDLIDSAAGTRWTGFPVGGAIGHVHVQVGDTASADRFYRDTLGFDVTTGYPGASFYGSGGYHHQMAANAWRSHGAGPRPHGMAGLDRVDIVMRDEPEIAAITAHADRAGIPVRRDGGRTFLHDPWGTAIALRH